jgi:hypothetical protein
VASLYPFAPLSNRAPRANCAPFLPVSSKTLPVGVHSRLNARGHYQLVISGASPAFRLGPAVTLGFTVGVQEVTTAANPKELKMREANLNSVNACLFILWDKARERGWLVRGATVALHLLRVGLQKTPQAAGFDSTSLKHLGDKDSSAFEVLDEFNKTENSLKQLNAVEDKPGNHDDSQPAATQDEVIKRVLGEILDGIYALLLQLAKDTRTLNTRSGLSGPVLTWYEERWGTTVKGWDFDDLVSNEPSPQVYVYKMDKDPGWLRMTRELNAAFLFARGLGEILEPRAHSCCPYFRTLPQGKNFLATDMAVLEPLITKYGGEDGFMNLPDKTVARLSQSQGWARRLDPFAHSKGPNHDLSELEPSCFPVQGLHTASLGQNERKNVDRDSKLIKSMYTKGEIRAMFKEHQNGVVVFGRQPGSGELKEMYRQRQKNSQPGKPHKSSSWAPSRSSTAGSTGQSAPAAGPKAPSQLDTNSRPSTSASDAKGVETPTKVSGQPSVKSATRRSTSVSSIRSTSSSTHPKAANVGPRAERPQTSTAQASSGSAHRVVGNVSLRSTDSSTQSKTATTGLSRPHEPTFELKAPTPAKTSSNSSVRTTGSMDSQATTGSPTPQKAAGKQSASTGLNKTTTNSSGRTTT